ncbi:heme NO-binding domain-containing protein [Ascidiimonas aurantiaca]|uniref:heme NO-binding domain-containing protein n=1 Tax=Ascidiimonas aurantiaca TaxID=1685432 RepID=UPI0030ED72BC
MKGVVFTRFLEMIEEEFGLETLDHIIETSNLPSKAIYTDIGTYDSGEMFTMIKVLSEKTGMEINDLVYHFGRYFFGTLTEDHPKLFEQYKTALELLSSIESHIHVHVKKIYPGAELPTFEVVEQGPSHLILIYRSQRALYHFARALMEKTFEHYNEEVAIQMELLEPSGKEVRFEVTAYG